MIVFSGWGILAVVPPVALFFLLGTITGSVWTGAIGLIAGGVVDWFLGIYFNQTRPARDLTTAMDARSRELHAMADAGTFYRGPGHPMPTSLADAHQQADQLAAEEYHALKNKVGNRHTLFWIPMQYLGVVCAVGGAVLMVFALMNNWQMPGR